MKTPPSLEASSGSKEVVEGRGGLDGDRLGRRDWRRPPPPPGIPWPHPEAAAQLKLCPAHLEASRGADK